MMDDEKAAQIQAVLAQMPKCECPCGCPYVLSSSVSLEDLMCFSCRHDMHYGGTKLLPEEETHA